MERLPGWDPESNLPPMRFAFLAAAWVVLSGVACTGPTEDPAPPVSSAAAEAEPTYSPFVLRMSREGRLPFGEISFKDVGMSVDPAERVFVYESVASSVAAALASSPTAPMSSEVVYSEAAADPASHLACGSRHIYVDVWAPQGTERWGYSLWSGCGEEDRFALREVPRRTADDVDALAEDIAATLGRAVERGCFVASC